MEKTEFIKIVKSVVQQPSIEGLAQIIANPPGRNPKKELVEISSWYNSLDLKGKEMAKKIIKLSSDDTLFGFLCLLDGVRTLNEAKGKLELYYVNGENKTLINADTGMNLHDIFNEE